jgi:hypothetical protein
VGGGGGLSWHTVEGEAMENVWKITNIIHNVHTCTIGTHNFLPFLDFQKR